ncbi:class I SAM-dependent methyltransferase [Luminiphilus sp.]|nr:class I SAM-dependent methyltransferase [Luminiphilus sp.]
MLAKKAVDDYSLSSAVDLGCGDFAVGRQLLEYFTRYTACDISSTILDQNKKLYDQENLEFFKINLAEDELPIGDIAFVRQVLQHLSNREIALFVEKLNVTKPYKYIVITEHLPFSSDFIPNIDKPSGPKTRVVLDSGVIICAPPFQLNYREKHEICTVEKSTGGRKALIKSVLYVL